MFMKFARMPRGAAAARLVILGSFALLAACATSGASTGVSQSATPSTPSAERAASSSRYVIAQTDLEKVKADNLYDAIYKLRPDFLRGRNENTSMIKQDIPGGRGDTGAAPGSNAAGTGKASASEVPVMVYKDNSRLAGTDDLRQILPSQVREVRFYPGPEAVIKFGTNNSNGAIVITSK